MNATQADSETRRAGHPNRHVAPDSEADEIASPSRHFRIRTADDHRHRSNANSLIGRRYGWRGYQHASLPSEQTDDRITLCATADGVAIGTITVGLDGHHGLLAEDVFPEEIDGLRKAGKRICEFTKLATEPAADAKRLLASLFHVAYIIAHRIRGCDTLVIEVNPRHVAYYRRLLGGRVLGDVRTNGRVNAPAVLLCFDLEQTRHQIDLNELKGQSRSNRDSLYSHGFSSCEEAGIMRLMSKPTGSTPESRI